MKIKNESSKRAVYFKYYKNTFVPYLLLKQSLMEFGINYVNPST